MEEVEKRRKWFETFAEGRGFDPLLSASWHELLPELEQANDTMVYLF